MIPLPFHSNSASPGRRRAFSVIELLVAVSVLTLIVLVLFKLFDQTQKALRKNVTQTDVLESGRAVLDTLVREFAEITPAPVGAIPLQFSGVSSGTYYQTNLYVHAGPFTPLSQSLFSDNTGRTNYLQEVFYLTRLGRDWTGVGLQVIPLRLSNGGKDSGVGTLYRWENTIREEALSGTNNLSRAFRLTIPTPVYPSEPTNFFKVTEGITHFRVTPCDRLGREMTYRWAQTNAYTNAYILRDRDFETASAFVADALPSFLDLEIGILESKTLEEFKSIPDPVRARKFLQDRASKVHLLRQRIPVRAGNQ